VTAKGKGAGTRLARRALIGGAVAASATLSPAALAAQCGARTECPPTARPEHAGVVRWSSELQVVGVNAALGGLTAGVVSKARGGSFFGAFGRGVLGGAGVYAGKRVAAARFAGAGLLGRQMAAVGGSVVRNAADGRAPFARLVLPAGLGRVYVDRTTSATKLRLSADLSTVVTTAYALSRSELRFDLAGSLSAGLPVFGARDGFQGTGWDGRHVAGVIWVRDAVADRQGGIVRSQVLAHEVVHAAQNDFAFTVWSLPAEARLARRLLGPASRYVDLGLQVPALGAATLLADYHQRPWEREAHYLSGERH